MALCAGGQRVAGGEPTKPPATLDPAWAPYVRVDTLAAAQAQAWLSVSGRLGYDEDRTQQIRPPVNGRITQVWVKLGQRVRAGDRLLGLVSPEAAQLKAELQKDAQDVEVLTHARERARSLLKDGAVSPREVAEAEAAYNKAGAELRRTQAHVAALGLDLERPGAEAVLVARQAGVVTARDAVVGLEVRADAATPVIVVSDLDHVWLWASVYERDLPQVALGANVMATVAAYPERRFVGHVDYVGDVLDADTHTVRVRCTLNNKQRALKPQMFATVQIEQPDRGLLWLPSDAVITHGETTSVVVVGAEDRLSLRAVSLGAIVAGRQPVIAGVVAGERIVGKGAVLVAQHLSRTH